MRVADRKFKALEESQRLNLKYYIIVIYIITISDTIFFSTNIDSTITTISQITIVLIASIMFINEVYKYNERINTTHLMTFGFLILILIAGMLVKKDFSFGYILKFSLLLAGFIFTKNLELDKFGYI